MKTPQNALRRGLLLSAMLTLCACGNTSPETETHDTTPPIDININDNSLSPIEAEQGWTLLFNGQNIEQWRNFKKETLSDKWQIRDNALTLTASDGGDILTKKTYKNFDLKLDWKISIAGNSGVFIMADEEGQKIYSHAIEIQILDNERHADNKLDTHLSGSVYDMIASPVLSHKAAGEWNHMRIRVQNKYLQVWQNGMSVTNIVINSPEWNDHLANSKFKNWPGFGLSEQGHIGLQDHGNETAFKNIKILELKDE